MRNRTKESINIEIMNQFDLFSSSSASLSLVLAILIGLLTIFVGQSLFSGPKKALNGSSMTHEFPLIEKEVLSHDTRRFRFRLPSDQHILGKIEVRLGLMYYSTTH